MHYSITEFEVIYRGCFQKALAVAQAMLHDADEARDVVQEAFIKLWETDSEIDNETGYIIRSVRNLSLNRLDGFDTRERMKRRLPLNEYETEDEPMISDEKLESALGTLLSPRERQVVDKIYKDNLSYRDAAGELDVSVSMVNKSIVGALKKLRKHFKTERK